MQLCYITVNNQSCQVNSRIGKKGTQCKWFVRCLGKHHPDVRDPNFCDTLHFWPFLQRCGKILRCGIGSIPMIFRAGRADCGCCCCCWWWPVACVLGGVGDDGAVFSLLRSL